MGKQNLQAKKVYSVRVELFPYVNAYKKRTFLSNIPGDAFKTDTKL